MLIFYLFFFKNRDSKILVFANFEPLIPSPARNMHTPKRPQKWPFLPFLRIENRGPKNEKKHEKTWFWWFLTNQTPALRTKHPFFDPPKQPFRLVLQSTEKALSGRIWWCVGCFEHQFGPFCNCTGAFSNCSSEKVVILDPYFLLIMVAKVRNLRTRENAENGQKCLFLAQKWPFLLILPNLSFLTSKWCFFALIVNIPYLRC